MEERIQKILARVGYGSRRSCEELILAGRLAAGSRIAELALVDLLGVSRTPRALPHFDRVEGYDAIKALAAQADFLVLIAPYSKVTHHLVNAELLNVMKKSACVLNLARGSLCDEAALIDALKTKRIAGAGLDVFNSEPLPADSPLWDMENVIITPHIATSSDYRSDRTVVLVVENVRRYLRGDRLLSVVDLAAGY